MASRPPEPAHAPKPADLASAFSTGAIRDKDWGDRVASLTPEGQKAVRDHFNSLADRYSLASRGEPASRIATADIKDMGGAGGFRHHDGTISISRQAMSGLSHHSEDPKLDDTRRSFITSGLGDPGYSAYHLMTHETIHGYGPTIPYASGPNARHSVLAEEMATEMSAHHIASIAHDADPYELRKAISYGDAINPAIEHVQQVAGVTHEQAFNAVTHAALTFKRRSGNVDPTDALMDIAEDSLRKVGRFTPETHAELFRRWDAVSSGILDKVKEMNANAKH